MSITLPCVLHFALYFLLFSFCRIERNTGITQKDEREEKNQTRTAFNAKTLFFSEHIGRKSLGILSHIANLWHNNNRRLDMVRPIQLGLHMPCCVFFFSIACAYSSTYVSKLPALLLSEMFELKSIWVFLLLHFRLSRRLHYFCECAI